jgi:hypothetical protein
MGTFKGTKGKWIRKEVITDNGFFQKVSVDLAESICNVTTRDHERSIYNALLISKAPEMLEMLVEMYEEWCETGIGQNKLDSYMSQIKQLIKEATEL